MFLTLALTLSLGVGTAALVAHAAGRKDRDQARLAFNQSLGLTMIVASAISNRA